MYTNVVINRTSSVLAPNKTLKAKPKKPKANSTTSALASQTVSLVLLAAPPLVSLVIGMRS